jgi:4-hydroxybenzoate polyprenyltransferase
VSTQGDASGVPPLLLIWRGTRVGKLVPVYLLVLGSALLPGGAVDCAGLALVEGSLFAFTALGMQLNVLSDRDLDRRAKPELARWLTAAPRVLRHVLVSEVATAMLLLVWLGASGRRASFLFALALGVLFNLYSYNPFFPRRAVELRLKAFWWGHALVGVVGYFLAWMVGFSCAGVRWPTAPLLVAAVASSVADYGVFLVESAQDAPDESDFGLETLPALVGRWWTIAIASVLVVVGTSLVVWASAGQHGASRWALAWVASLQTVAALLGLVSIRGASRHDRRWEKVVDISFFVGRMGMVTILLAARLS